MRILIFGSGGVGGYFGGRFAEAGHAVTFVARGAHLAAIRERGLRIESVAGDATISPASAVGDPAEAEIPELVLVCVKAGDVPEAARLLAPALSAESLVVPLENGVTAVDELSAALGAERVVGGLCRIVSFLAAPGVVRHTGVAPAIVLGEPEGGPSERVERLRSQLSGAVGVDVDVAPDFRLAMWQKFLFIAPYSGVGAVSRQAAGPMRSVPETRALLEGAMREVAAVARARGIAISDAAIARTLAFADALPPDSTASMQRDLMEGRPSELDAQTGSVVRLGREAGVPTPIHDVLYAALLPMERAARGVRPA